jgi:hypothetical protein
MMSSMITKNTTEIQRDSHGNLIVIFEGIGPPVAVRYAVIDGEYWFNEIDLVKAGTGKDGNQSGMWLRRNQSRLCNIRNQCKVFRFMGFGQKNVNLITFNNAINLITMLPGPIAQAIRANFIEIGHRYLGGDTTMKKEIDANTVSKHVVNASARASLKLPKIQSPMPRQVVVKYIYATQTPAFPGAIKIGRAKNVKNRISSGNTFIKLAQHKVVAVAPSLNYIRDEKLAHAFFASRRIKGEFFRVTVAEVKQFFDSYIKRTFMDEMFKKEQKMLTN